MQKGKVMGSERSKDRFYSHDIFASTRQTVSAAGLARRSIASRQVM
jgi:hypothetical protein